jgi:hypothetical protein
MGYILGKLPWFQFYPGDWMKDPALRACSLPARGLYMDMLCIFFESPERGISPYAAGKLEAKAWAKVVGHRADYVKKLVAELELNRVLSRRPGDRRLYSRRLVREEIERKKARERQRKHRGSVTPYVTHLSQPSSSSSSSSEVISHMSQAEEERTTAAAFTDIGFEQPFGRPNFQAIWVTHFLEAKRNGTWLTQAMENTIQECQKVNIGIPPQFYDAKHDVEAREKIEFDNKHRKVPL